MDLRSRFVSLALSTFAIFPGTIKANECAIPITSEAIADYLVHAKSNVVQLQDNIISIPADQKTYENTLRPWNQLGSHILLNFSILSYVAEGNFPATYSAYKAMQDFAAFLLQSVIVNPTLQSTLMAYAGNALGEHPQNPYQNYQISCILNSYETIKPSLPFEEQVQLDILQSQYKSLKQTPFLYLEGLSAEKSLSSEQEGFTVFDLNTCFVPGELAFVHGGMARWEERLAALADKILCVDADVVCLQEIFTEEAGVALYEKLKDNYAHFYVAIGPRPLGFSPTTFGLPSGLFVASKYAVEKPFFTPFAVTGLQMNYGVFDFIIKSGSTALGHIYTTHMQSLNTDLFPEIRAKELTQIVEKIQSDYQAEPDTALPRFLCGDLNIAWGSGEPGEALIRNYFYDAYNHGRSEVNAEERTCTNYFSEFCFQWKDYPDGIDANAEILDYALLYQPLPGYSNKPICRKCSIKTALIPMNAFDRPESAISDHHGLLTTIRANNRKR